MSYATTLRQGERLQIGDIIVTLVLVQGFSRSRLRVECPDDVKVTRLEALPGSIDAPAGDVNP